MATFQPPPTYAEVGLVDKVTGRVVFNPIWLKWFIDLASVVGSVPSGGGLTGTVTNHAILKGTGAAVGSLALLTNGQLFIGNTGNDPSAASLTAGANITITPGAGSIQIDAAGGGASGETLIDSGSLSGASVTTAAITSAFAYIQLECLGYSFSGGATNLRIQPNGDSTAADYLYSLTSSGTIGTNAALGDGKALALAGDTGNTACSIFGYAGARSHFLTFNMTNDEGGGPTPSTANYTGIFKNGAITSLKILATAGTFAGGTYTLKGFN